MLAASLLAQHGTMVRGGGRAHFPGNVVVPPIGSAVPPLGPGSPTLPAHPWAWRQGLQRDNGFNFPSLGYTSYFDPFYTSTNQMQPSPSIIVVMPQMELPPPPAPPPPPIQPQTREYNWPASSGGSAATSFSIVTKDQKVASAVAVWVQNNQLCYTAPEGSAGCMPIDSVDREATRRRNAEMQLILWLPSGS
jgi:hypothetical protein